MKFLIICVLLSGVGVFAQERVKRQATYTFPGPRTDPRSRAAPNSAPVYVVDEPAEQHYPSSRRQYQPQQAPPQYVPVQHRQPVPVAPVAPVAPVSAPTYEGPRSRSDHSSHSRSASSSSSRRATSGRANKYGSSPQQSLSSHDEEEEEDDGPDPLTLLLQDSQFSCGGKQDGYYADDSVNCQVFHYCVSGAKHSWMCPENTVFHQVHLNCVPEGQDICSQSQKFHFVNEYLYKPVDYDGPNKTARYSQRYYPENYVVGDPIIPPQDAPRRQPAPQQAQAYQPAQAYHPITQTARSPPRQVAPPPPPSYRPAPPQHVVPPQAPVRHVPRTSRPLESYPVEAPSPAAYRVPVQQQPSQPPPEHTYRVIPQPPPQVIHQERPPLRPAPPESEHLPRRTSRAHRVAAAQLAASSPHQPPSYSSSEEDVYQPHSRRPAPPSGYAPPRQSYRPIARSAAASYRQPHVATSRGSGVEYDEEY